MNAAAAEAAVLGVNWAVAAADQRPKPNMLTKLPGLPLVLHRVDALLCQNAQIAALLACHSVRVHTLTNLVCRYGMGPHAALDTSVEAF
jgi:hypothetical protein